jgi:ribosomal protein L37E
MSTITTPDARIVERVRDSVSGEIFEIEYKKCAYCGQPIYDIKTGYHKECVRNFRQQEAFRQQEWQNKQDIEMFGEVLSDHERKRRTYPSSKVDGRESYNDQLKREAEEHRQNLQNQLNQIYQRRRRLPELEQELKYLKATANKDNELEKQLELELNK